MLSHGSDQSESHREELHESQNTDGLKNRHSCLHLKLHPHSSAGIGLFWKLDFREMMLVFGLMLLLLQTAACLEFNCRFNQKDPCYAALGHKLSLKMVDTSEYHLKIYKRINNNHEDPVCRVKKDKIRKFECDLFNNRAEVTVINGTLIINRVIRADSGNYTLRLDHSDGTETYTDLQVNVEAPIGSVEVSISCSSNGMKSVSCSSDGDQLIYSWTLNGQSLMDGNTTIELNETDGIIICSVKNHVSQEQKSISVQPCPGLEFNCRFNQADPCYAALGHKLSLKMVDTSKYDLMIQKRINNNQDDPVCRVRNDKIKQNQCDLFNNIAEVTVINGILIINRVNRADSGNYTLTLDRSDGTVTSADLQVNVEAPIGSVNVSISCSSNGMKSVSCSSDGDQLIYSWTLNGDSLMDGNTTIELNEETDGNIICSVKNHVSHEQKSIRVKQCPGSTTAAVTSSLTSTLTSSTQTSDHVCSESVVFVLVWSFQMMVLFGLLGGFHIYMRHTSGKKQEDQKVRMRRFREGHEHTAEDSGDQQQISSHL